jgi:hypothetical protein
VGVNEKPFLGQEDERVCNRLANLHTEYDINCMAKGLYGILGNFDFIYLFFDFKIFHSLIVSLYMVFTWDYWIQIQWVYLINA